MNYRSRGKRVFDVIASSLFIVLLFPIFVVVTLVIWAFLGSPVLFRQERPGLAGKPFLILKFRTMRNTFDANGEPLSDHDRTTQAGRFLRNHSLDELPELVNVLRGDMSLVGPRPLMMRYLPRYSDKQARRHEVRPGITGLAQVRGRNAISWDEKFAYDLEYVDELSFSTDLQILTLTVVEVFRASGVNADDETTMPEFWGTAAAPVNHDT